METKTNRAKEIEALLKKRVKLMTDNLPALRIQDEYSRLKANIAENTLREEMSKIKHASLLTPPEPEDQDAPPLEKTSK